MPEETRTERQTDALLIEIIKKFTTILDERGLPEFWEMLYTLHDQLKAKLGEKRADAAVITAFTISVLEIAGSITAFQGDFLNQVVLDLDRKNNPPKGQITNAR